MANDLRIKTIPAWYFAAYLFKDGTFSEPSSIIRVPVLLVSA